MNSTLDELHALFKQHKIDYSLFKDQVALETAISGVAKYGIVLSEAAPTLIMKANKAPIVVIIRGDTRVSFNKLKQALSISKVCLAKPEEVYSLTGAKVGYVSLINPAMETWIDKKILEKEYVYGGCGVQNHTLKIKVVDLVKLTKATVSDFTDMKEVELKST